MSIIDELKKKSVECDRYIYVCKDSASFYSKKQDLLTTISILCSVLIGGFSTFGYAYDLFQFLIIAQVIAYVNTFLTAYLKYGCLENKASELRRLSVRFSTLSSTINKQLIIPTEDKETFYKWLDISYVDLINNLPDYILDSSLQKYKIKKRDYNTDTTRDSTIPVNLNKSETFKADVQDAKESLKDTSNKDMVKLDVYDGAISSKSTMVFDEGFMQHQMAYEMNRLNGT